MDFSSNLIAILGAVALVIVCNLWRGKNSKKIKGKLVPVAPGGLPIIGHLHQLGGSKSLARTLGEMADKYGSIFCLRLGVHPTVIITDHKAMKDVFTTNDKLFASRPHSSQAMIVGYNYSSFGFAPYGTYWRNMRKLATIELLSNHRTKILNYVQISEVSTLVKELMVAGKRYFDGNKEARDDAGRPIGEIIREFMFVTGALVPGDLIPFLGWLDINGVVKTMKRVTKEVDVIVDSWIEEHKKKSDNDAKKDFLDVMLSVVEDDASMVLTVKQLSRGRQRDPNIWSDPEAFIPERFLTTNANLDVTGQNFEYAPFSAGRRSCPGLNLAMQSCTWLLRLIQAYDMKTPTNEPVDMTEAQGIVLPRKTPLEILVVPRLAPEFYEQE
ncbi:hypothetical protein GH714_026373 [Hevea brasiliensis]|uniref:Cytochrome P450 n=1 Tax=Hevea brasiliensis TaxID=3981 RepID=A0A6A6K8W7_HEVBR|nr:hypothetical protein GH714_026373 [Hevea brasiliensis]